jgi:SAM-dependent MidA family methyltransferase
MAQPLSSLPDALRALFGSDEWIPFDRFMRFALVDPDHGFYSQKKPVFGQEGHFVTAPMLGDWLAVVIAQEATSLARRLREAGKTFCIREYGPGNGQLAADLLGNLGQRDCWPHRYECIEASVSRQTEQAARLSASPGAIFSAVEVLWPKTQEPFDGLALANEFLDALPVRLFEWQPDHAEGPVLEWGLRYAPDTAGSSLRSATNDPSIAVSWQAKPADPDFCRLVSARAQAASQLGLGWRPGHRGEWCPELVPWVKTVASRLRFGEVLVFDYGYEAYELDHPDRPFGTLAGHSAHRRIDDWQALVAAPGTIDLTAHVNFTELAQAFQEEGFEVELQTQAAWMLDRGILDKARERLFTNTQDLAGAPPPSRASLAQLSHLQMLLGDSAMGQSFMVLSARRLSI